MTDARWIYYGIIGVLAVLVVVLLAKGKTFSVDDFIKLSENFIGDLVGLGLIIYYCSYLMGAMDTIVRERMDLLAGVGFGAIGLSRWWAMKKSNGATEKEGE